MRQTYWDLIEKRINLKTALLSEWIERQWSMRRVESTHSQNLLGDEKRLCPIILIMSKPCWMFISQVLFIELLTGFAANDFPLLVDRDNQPRSCPWDSFISCVCKVTKKNVSWNVTINKSAGVIEFKLREIWCMLLTISRPHQTYRGHHCLISCNVLVPAATDRSLNIVT